MKESDVVDKFFHSPTVKNGASQQDDSFTDVPERIHSQDDETMSDTEDESATPGKLYTAGRESGSIREHQKAEETLRPKIKSKIGRKPSTTPEKLSRKPIHSKIGGKRAEEGATHKPIKLGVGEPKASRDNSPTSSTTGETGDEEHESAIEKAKEPQPSTKKLTAEEKALENRMKLKRELEEKKRKTVKKARKF